MADPVKETKHEGSGESRGEGRPEGRRPHSGPRGGDSRGGKRPYFRRRKVCKFCAEKIDRIDYKDIRLLQQFVAERGRIIPRRISGACPQQQRRLCRAIKQARNIALLPFAAEV